MSTDRTEEGSMTGSAGTHRTDGCEAYSGTGHDPKAGNVGQSAVVTDGGAARNSENDPAGPAAGSDAAEDVSLRSTHTFENGVAGGMDANRAAAPASSANSSSDAADAGPRPSENSGAAAGAGSRGGAGGQETKPSSPKRHGGPKLVLRFFETVFVLAIAAAAFLYFDCKAFLSAAAAEKSESVVFVVEQGSSLRAVAEKLKREGIVSDAFRFYWYARLTGKERSIRAGTFLVSTGWTPDRLLAELTEGKALLYKVTIREGLPMWEVARLLEKEEICRAGDFLAVTASADFLRHHGILGPNAEGYLYPDTYLFSKPEKLDYEAARKAADRLVYTFRDKTDGLWPEGAGGEQKRRAVILASIVEKETGADAERARVAGVYANRLAKNMLLQADPTVIYGIGPAFSGRLLKKDLENASNPYNTYRIAGLPPGPICSPGAAALKAALEPEKHDYLYFVATGTDKTHVFSRTLEEHNKAVQRYRAAVRAANSKSN